MRTITLRTAAGRAIATIGVLAALAALAAFPAPAGAQDAPAAGAPAAAAAPADGDRIFQGRLDAGHRAIDVDDDRSLLFPYDPLADGPVLGVDLLYLTPGFGSLRLEAGYVDGDAWRAGVEYNHGADLAVKAGTTSFTHARQHAAPIPTVTGVIEVEADDADPGREYRDELREDKATVKVRAPGYPAHFRASGRILRNEGTRQLPIFFRSCTTHLCHANSRTRELDQETKEYTLGVDAHAGPADLAYSYTARTFRDDAPDPTLPLADTYPGFVPAGTYPHDVNPDLKSFSNDVNLNTNLTNRVALSAAWSGGEQENEDYGITRSTQSAGATLSWRAGRSFFLVGRYAYDEERSEDLGAEALALREARNASHTASHRHAVDPERTRHTAELAATLSPARRLNLDAKVRYRTLERYAIFEKEDGAFVDEATDTESTLATLKARWRALGGLDLDASLGQEWTDDPLYSTENTALTRYGLGATWTPGPAFLARAAWQGYRGKNDEEPALEHAYAVKIPGDPSLEREVSGDAFSLAATYLPVTTVSVTASWSLTDNGVEQDLLLGNAGTPGYWYLSRDTAWSGRMQMADLRARWELSKRLALTAEGLWIDSLESYAPTVAQASGLEEISRVEFTKLLASLQADVRVTDAVGVVLSAFWTRYNDQAGDDGDGTAKGLLASVSYRW